MHVNPNYGTRQRRRHLTSEQGAADTLTGQADGTDAVAGGRSLDGQARQELLLNRLAHARERRAAMQDGNAIGAGDANAAVGDTGSDTSVGANDSNHGDTGGNGGKISKGQSSDGTDTGVAAAANGGDGNGANGSESEGADESQTKKTTTTTTVAKPLAEVLNAEEGDADLAHFADLQINFSLQAPQQAPHPKCEWVWVASQFQQQMGEIKKMPDLSDQEKSAHIQALNMTLKHINNTFNAYVRMTHDLQSVLDSDFSSYEAIKQWQDKYLDDQRKRIAELQVQAMREHAALEKFQENQQKLEAFEDARKGTAAKRNSVDQVLSRVEDKAKALQQFLDDHAYIKAQHVKDSSLITVVKIESHDESEMTAQEEKSRRKGNDVAHMSFLVDADNNQYALARPSDTTNLLEDFSLLNDLLSLLFGCFVAGAACQYLNLPGFVGYVIAGTLLGPAGLNIITSVVQITTIGEFGVFFVLFTLGMEFSVSKLKEMFRIAVIGCTLIMALTITAVCFIGSYLERPLSETLFVAIVVSLSSTTVAANNLTPTDHEQPYGRGLLGVLLMQDVYLGVIIAVLPLLVSFDEINVMDIGRITFRLIGSFILLGLIIIILSKFVVERLMHHLHSLDIPTRLLAIISICILMLKVTEFMQVSMELGCFVAGLMFSIAGGRIQAEHAHDGVSSNLSRILHLVDPVKDLFLAIFFSSVGMHVYPTFLYTNALLLVGLVACTLAVKYAASFIILHFFVKEGDAQTNHVISVGLAQVSEFALVLAGRGRRLRIVSQPVYFLLLSITSVTLLLAPMLWRAFHPHRRTVHSRSITHVQAPA
ncbi:hypothetical protein PTSG_11772 [Salpingoeca rosetta]|uniref:Cation/H+ exchanger transmembrane domain-containing protein n=1 Tax=Salpingoeca rosetta (strain ATCC 50818 / BSB-021) TaxID=946362 RepID=F2TYQ0_SALR5|nr:uncharacterized protein PTSG_11772 [Salpingoeca rosetta]EGD78724.1 hypothetical protein PTSG_11772 [Salpingoeca rosetta]|eukprot:XP_004997681.1 hypothetical protein PTSG_11772 [Salpingoeca rosetta]